MLKTYRLLLDISVSSLLNRTLYYIRRLPVVGHRIPDSLYGNREWKQGISMVALLMQFLWTILNKVIYLGLICFWPAMMIQEIRPAFETIHLFLSILLPMSFLTAAVWNARVMEPRRDKYVAVRLLHIPATRYMKATLFYRYATFCLSFVIALSIFIPIVGGTVLDGIMIAFVITASRLIAEWFHLYIFERTGKVIIRSNSLIFLSLFVGAALAYGLPLLQVSPTYGTALLYWPLALLIIIFGLGAGLKLIRYTGYPEAVGAATRRDDPLLNLGQMMTDSRKAEVATKSDDFNESQLLASNKTVQSHRYIFLNRLFFQRHRRLVIKPLKTRLVIGICVSVLASIILLFLYPDHEWTLAHLAPYLPFFLYHLAIGEKLCRALFYNCDMPLMRYPFYRQAAWQHFVIRLIRIVGMNIVLVSAIGVVLTLAYGYANTLSSMEDLLFIWAILLSMAILLSVHHLSLYYLLQPFTTEMHAKNPLYLIVNMIMSSSTAMLLVFQPQLPHLTAGIGIAAVGYLLASVILIRLYGARTFRLK